MILFLIGAVLWLCLKPLVLLDELRQKRARKKTGIRIAEVLPKVVDALQQLTASASEDSFATVQLLGKEDHFVQFWLENGKVHGQAPGKPASNQVSPHSTEWTRQLERLGWKSPTEDTQSNYWRQWSREDTDTLESIGKHILRVFREVCHADPNELVQLDLTL